MAWHRFLTFWIVAFLGVAPLQSQQTTLDHLMSGMSLEQKVGQMFMASFYGTQLNQPAQELIERWQPGAFVLLPSNLESPAQITRLTNSIQQSLIASGSIPAFIAVDQEGGVIAHLEDGFTQFPVPMLLTATQNPDLAYRVGQALATELKAVGFNMNLAPVADLHTNSANPIIGRRSFGSDAEQVAPIIQSVVEGMQENGVLATVKHFPGHGDTNEDSHLALPVLMLDNNDLQSRELVPFKAAIDASAGAVMVAHISLPLLEAEQDVPASLSARIVTGLLRQVLGHEGIIITDALDMDAIDVMYSPAEAAVRAVQAGNDMVILGAHVSPQTLSDAMQAVVDAVRSETIHISQIDTSVRRILEAKQNYSVLNWQALDPVTAETRINQQQHEALVEELFAAGITLVQGELLPDEGKTLFVFPAVRQSLWQSCQSDGYQALGVSSYPTLDEIQWAAVAAQSADRVIVFTENAENNPQQQALVGALPPEKTLVVALWSPYDIRVLPQTAGYLVTYSPLRQLYRPLCAILRGENQAIGTLSVDL